MGNKMRNWMIMAAVLAISVLVWGAVAAQEATVEPTAEVAPAESGADMPTQAKPFLGVALEESADGVTIGEVVAGSAAESAGLQVGDIITAVNGTDVTTVAEVADAIGAMAVGDEVTIGYTRDGESLTATATLGEQVKPSMQMGQGPRGQGGNGQRGQGRAEQMFGFSYNSDDQTWTLDNLPEDSTLYAAGLREGDVISTVDGEAYDPASLARYLISLDADATVTLSVERDGAAQDITISASDLMSIVGMRGMLRDNGMFDGNFGQMMPFIHSALGNGRLGVSFQPLDAQLAEEHGLSVSEGALITDVQTDTPAATAGLVAGDVVTAVNGEAVDEEHTLRNRLIAYEAGDTVTLTVLRDGASQDIQATLDEQQMPEMGGLFGNLPFNFDFHHGNGGGFLFDMRPGQDGIEATPEVTPNA